MKEESQTILAGVVPLFCRRLNLFLLAFFLVGFALYFPPLPFSVIFLIHLQIQIVHLFLPQKREEEERERAGVGE